MTQSDIGALDTWHIDPDAPTEFDAALRPASDLGEWLRGLADDVDEATYYMDESPLVITVAQVNGKWRASMMYADQEIDDGDATRE